MRWMESVQFSVTNQVSKCRKWLRHYQHKISREKGIFFLISGLPTCQNGFACICKSLRCGAGGVTPSAYACTEMLRKTEGDSSKPSLGNSTMNLFIWWGTAGSLMCKVFAHVKRYIKATELSKSQENLSEYTELETKLHTCESESKKQWGAIML